MFDTNTSIVTHSKVVAADAYHLIHLNGSLTMKCIHKETSTSTSVSQYTFSVDASSLNVITDSSSCGKSLSTSLNHLYFARFSENGDLEQVLLSPLDNDFAKQIKLGIISSFNVPNESFFEHGSSNYRHDWTSKTASNTLFRSSGFKQIKIISNKYHSTFSNSTFQLTTDKSRANVSIIVKMNRSHAINILPIWTSSGDATSFEGLEVVSPEMFAHYSTLTVGKATENALPVCYSSSVLERSFLESVKRFFGRVIEACIIIFIIWIIVRGSYYVDPNEPPPWRFRARNYGTV
ncbi:hypothetical protein P9112_009373 [Eukaryota sp. TZLM1-RC]